MLTNELGLSVFGTLRLNYDVAASSQALGQTGSDTPASVMAQLRDRQHDALQAELIVIIEAPLEATLTVPLLTGPAPVRLTGIVYLVFGFPLSAVLFNTGTPSVVVEFGYLSGRTLLGGLLWQPGPPGSSFSVPFSLLAQFVDAPA